MMIIALSCRRCNKGRRCHGYADNFGAIGCVVAAESCRWARRAFEADPSHPTAGSPSTGGGIEDALAAMSDRMDDSRARCPAKVTASEDSRYQPRLDQTTTRVRLRWLGEVRQMSAIGTYRPPWPPANLSAYWSSAAFLRCVATVEQSVPTRRHGAIRGRGHGGSCKPNVNSACRAVARHLSPCLIRQALLSR
jgi:hypothetical protein